MLLIFAWKFYTFASVDIYVGSDLYIYIIFFFLISLSFLFICSTISAFDWQRVTFAEDRSCRQMSR